MTKRKDEHERLRPSREGEGRPGHAPSDVDRKTVEIMVAGGIVQADIARARDISENTLLKHYRAELDSGMTALNTKVLLAFIKRIEEGDFQAIKWWTQTRMGWSERVVVDDGKPANTPMRVIVEFVGAPGPPLIEQSAPWSGPQLLSDEVRRNVHLVG